MAGTKAANLQVIDGFFKDFENQKIEETGKTVGETIFLNLGDMCEMIVREAVTIRQHPMEEGHNFTGNLINSIVGIVYWRSKNKKEIIYAQQAMPGLKPAIRRELSSMTYKKRQRSYNIHFRPGSRFGDVDWEGAQSTIKASSLIPTDESYGRSDAIQFANRWRPSTNSNFVICIAYTSEYASFVEMQRGTTGILETQVYANRVAKEFFELKRV